MMYMLDTNILIHAIRYRPQTLLERLHSHIGGELCISAITYTELIYGVLRSNRQDQNMKALQAVLSGIYILPFDMKAADHAGEVMAYLASRGTPIGDRDALIAAHARSLSIVLVTDNTREFVRVPGLTLENWIDR